MTFVIVRLLCISLGNNEVQCMVQTIFNWFLSQQRYVARDHHILFDAFLFFN